VVAGASGRDCTNQQAHAVGHVVLVDIYSLDVIIEEMVAGSREEPNFDMVT
jgi:hypothetical protein